MDSEKAPYFVVLALSAFAWGVGYFYDKIVASPIVEYVVSDEPLQSPDPKAPVHRKMTLELQNITDSTLFTSIIVSLRPREGEPGRIGDIDMLATGHGYSGDIVVSVRPRSASFEIPNVQPRVVYRAVATYRSDKKAELTFDSRKQAVRFVECGLLTWMIKHAQEVVIYTVLAIPVLLAAFGMMQMVKLCCAAGQGSQKSRQSSGRSADGGSP